MAATACTGSRFLRNPERARFLTAVLALAAIAILTPALAQQPPPPIDETPADLPNGKGRDETFYACVVCHGSAIIKQQGMTRERWDQTLTWMTEKHNMAPPDAAERALIVDYLAATFPPRQRGRPNPFLN